MPNGPREPPGALAGCLECKAPVTTRAPVPRLSRSNSVLYLRWLCSHLLAAFTCCRFAYCRLLQARFRGNKARVAATGEGEEAQTVNLLKAAAGQKESLVERVKRQQAAEAQAEAEAAAGAGAGVGVTASPRTPLPKPKQVNRI